ncbi:hypothetical protein T07_12721 [Trichinella nelsoni]|uniref:Uncharacterized protein n=1 Tax=Trichinella nelsoni TaxID=6336 RepID=A0A0V0RIF8_9BILA|nr:hypothetical protein T07_12721 [Trichinella nelsoni]
MEGGLYHAVRKISSKTARWEREAAWEASKLHPLKPVKRVGENRQQHRKCQDKIFPLSMAREIKLPEELTERSWKRY